MHDVNITKVFRNHFKLISGYTHELLGESVYTKKIHVTRCIFHGVPRGRVT